MMTPAPYSSIASAFIRAKIRSTRWADRAHIDRLILIQRWLRGERIGWTTALGVGQWVQDYPVEVQALRDELAGTRCAGSEELSADVTVAKLMVGVADPLNIERRDWEEAGGLP